MIYQPQAPAWQRALRRATRVNVEARVIGMTGDERTCVETWLVSSPDHPSALQQVRVVWTHDGLSTVACSCRTSRNGRPCQHAAAAVEAAYQLTDEEAG